MSTPTTASPRSSWFRLGRIAWPGLFAVGCGILVASIPGYMQLMDEGLTPSHLVIEVTSSTSLLTALTLLTSVGVALASLALAWVLYRRAAADPMALFVSYFLVFHAFSTAGPIEALEPFVPGIANLNVYVLQPVIFIPLSMTLFASFPDGRLVPPWTRWLIVVSIIATPISVLASPLVYSGSMARFPVFLAVTYVVLFGVAVTMLYAQIYRYRNISTPLQRQQTKWVILGIGVWFFLVGISTGPWLVIQSLPLGSRIPWWGVLGSLIWAGSTAVIPVTLALSILKFRLYDVDLIINRTIVYAALTALIAGLYILAVTTFGALFQSNLIIALLATALAAVVIQPLRDRLQRGVNRLMYGERDDPYTVLARLGRTLEATLSPEATLSGVVKTIAQTLRLPYVAVVSDSGGEPAVVASYGLESGQALSLPLAYQGGTFGELRVSGRPSTEAFTPAEQRLLQDIARQVSVVAHSVQLTIDLRRAHQELVSSREEERRRLRRDLHDGLGPALAALNLRAGAIRRLLPEDPTEADVRVSELKGEIRSTIEEVRRLVYGLRPPALDELGLVEAIRANAEQTNRTQGKQGDLHVVIHAPDATPPLPAAVEVAAFRIVQEAVANVVHHARARDCLVSLSFDGHLHLEIRDDGVGIPEMRRSGVGLISMRERAVELGGSLHVERAPGGGTLVRARLPLDSPFP